MSEECPHCGETNYNDSWDESETRPCFYCGQDFKPRPSSDGMFYDREYHDDSSNDDPDLYDPDQGD